jgi:ABC-type multidrug transport system fused ATPase/permease subunit
MTHNSPAPESATDRHKRGGEKAGPARGRGGQPGKGPGRASGPLLPIIRRLLVYLRPHTTVLACVVGAILLTTLAELIPPWLIRKAVDEGILAGQMKLIWWVGGALLALSLIQGGVDFGRLFIAAAVGQRIVFRIRNDLFVHLSRLSFAFYDRARTGDLMSRLTADVDALSQFYGRAAVIVLTNALMLVGILLVLTVWNWRLGILYLAFLPLIVYAMKIYASRVQPAMGRSRRHLAGVTSAVQESLTGIAVVKLFGREAFEEDRADRQNKALLGAGIETTRITSLWMPFATVLGGMCTGLVLWFGGRSVIDQTISLGTLVGFTVYMSMLLRPIRQTGMMLNVVMRAAAAGERVFELLDMEETVRDAPDARPLPPARGQIRYEGVHFSYDNQKQALRGIDLEVEPGETLALVGPSGSGKSTLVHLLPRFYEAQQGRILLDGHDIRQVTLESLRDAIGIAMQNVFLFDASIGENIAYGSPDSSQGEIEAVAAAVRMAEFIESLPMGYGTPVGERGVALSGGQRQRIALARVLLIDPPILVLDEPTSSVDAHTEQQVREALQTMWANRTTIVIAHRLWTIQQADRIAVLDEGRIVEEARTVGAQSAHEALLAGKGLYRDLVRLQFSAESHPRTRSYEE